MSGILYSDEEIINALRSGLREHILHINHPEIVKMLDEEAEEMMKGLSVPEMRRILARKIVRNEESLIDLVMKQKKRDR